ncbi:MAG: hypothetical protein GT600_15825 [Bacteroidales bacterium]|jgi:hypothetical protein|nr:hypothetical protein [Bacteroidales bacterium]NMD03091.1 hypothetical protein [Bacteroidales bacterium]OQB64102.1 MAG: hypothetical protein BWX96_00876 [Bacteroidetes bacterium ADurb.Bin145]HOU02443.1 hypothetical protein [Bacteroidales bacterium]HQK67928.1 hypothetical protein [Bacteroidales bacterium]
MKKVRHFKADNQSGFVRINAYTWVAKKVGESDEGARQRFLTKLSQSVENPFHKLSEKIWAASVV